MIFRRSFQSSKHSWLHSSQHSRSVKYNTREPLRVRLEYVYTAPFRQQSGEKSNRTFSITRYDRNCTGGGGLMYVETHIHMHTIARNTDSALPVYIRAYLERVGKLRSRRPSWRTSHMITHEYRERTGSLSDCYPDNAPFNAYIPMLLSMFPDIPPSRYCFDDSGWQALQHERNMHDDKGVMKEMNPPN